MSEWTSSAERFLEQARADDDAAEEGALMNEQPSFADAAHGTDDARGLNGGNESKGETT